MEDNRKNLDVYIFARKEDPAAMVHRAATFTKFGNIAFTCSHVKTTLTKNLYKKNNRNANEMVHEPSHKHFCYLSCISFFCVWFLHVKAIMFGKINGLKFRQINVGYQGW